MKKGRERRRKEEKKRKIITLFCSDPKPTFVNTPQLHELSASHTVVNFLYFFYFFLGRFHGNCKKLIFCIFLVFRILFSSFYAYLFHIIFIIWYFYFW
jgi:hypothetical protein